MNLKGTLYIIAAASGTGKTSLAKALVATVENVKISISHTTRPIRSGETADRDYFFVDEVAFESLIKKEEFLEHARVFNHYYGTSRRWVEGQLNAGIDVILDIDWQGAQQVRKRMGCISIFLLPPSRNELRLRLERRKREDAKIIEDRLAAAGSEISHCKEFDYIVINDKFESALEDLKAIVCGKRLQCEHQIKKHDMLIKELLNN
ncbi:MAG: Guanylate kinase [uncultured bacterium]|nr:MAG: Guanylate kinase [uncultured bacterium]